MKRVVIIGAGVTGLTCAYRLARAGHRATIYERSPDVGGLAASFEMEGSIFDYGPHEFCTENPVLIEILRDVLGDDFLVRQKHAAQLFNGRFVDYPLSPVQVLQQFSPALSLRVLFEVTLQRLKNLVYSVQDYSFEKWVAHRFGKTMYRRYFGPYTEKVWGVDPDCLDPRTASNRISFNSVFDYVLKATAYYLFKRDDFSTIHSPLKHQFYYARRGVGTLTRRLAEQCEAVGVEIHRGWTLDRIVYDHGVAGALHFDNGEVLRDFDYLVSTIPVTRLLSCLGLPAPQAPIRFRSMIFVFLQIPREQMSPFSWIYFPDPNICFQRSTDFAHLRADMNPPGKTGVCLEISCFADDPVWRLEDGEIVARVRRDLHRVGLLDRDLPCPASVVRRRFVYPIQIIGYLELVHGLLAPIRAMSNAVSTGRQGLYKYCNMNECMEMAIEVAEQIDAGTTRFRYELDSKWRGAGLETERVA
jgi:protoporphyrinogen oxidase